MQSDSHNHKKSPAAFIAAIWSELKHTRNEHRLAAWFVLLSTMVLLIVTIGMVTRGWAWTALAAAPANVIALVLTYLGDRRAAQRETVAALSARWVVALVTVILFGTVWGLTIYGVVIPFILILLLSIAALTVPIVLTWLAYGLTVVPLLRRLPQGMRSREALYLIVTVLYTLWAVVTFLPWFGPWMVVIVLMCLISARFHHTIWERTAPLAARWSPHLGVWCALVSVSFVALLLPADTLGYPISLVPVDSMLIRHFKAIPQWREFDYRSFVRVASPGRISILLVIACGITSTAGAVAWTLKHLRLPLRESRVQSTSTTADPSQLSGSAYSDVHGYVTRLVEMIKIREEGVFGLTGLRGAGKSSLARSVVHVLGPHHFTLEVTSPARHDPGMGFFVSVCRAVAQRVRDDLRPSFDPHPGVFGVLERSLRNLALVVLGSIGALSLTLQSSYFADPSHDSFLELEISHARQIQTSIAETLESRGKSRIGQSAQAPDDRWQYMVVPSSSRNFLVIPVRSKGDHRRVLSELRDMGALSWAYDDMRLIHLPKGVPPHYARHIAQLVLHRDSQCHRNSAVSNILICAALDAPEGSNPLELVMTEQELVELDELLGYYADSLIQSIHAEPKFSDIEMGGFTLPAPGRSTPGNVFWLSVTLFALVVLGSFIWAPFMRLLRSIANRERLMLYQEAGTFLEELSFSESRERSGGLAWSGLSFGMKRTLADREMTLPGLTARYQHFVASACRHYNGKLIIVVDELDKVHDIEQVQGLLSEIKGALSVKGTYYILSISEDAASLFRKRLSSGRDIFESTFDEILYVPRMGLGEKGVAEFGEMLKAQLGPQRTTVPEVVGALLAGGIPREVLRNYRVLQDERHEDDLAGCQGLVEHELRDWITQLATSRLSGEEVMAVRRFAIEARAHVLGLKFADAFRSLEHCMKVIDPMNLRGSARDSELVDKSDTKEHLHARMYAALSHDIQSCLRLQVLVTIGQLLAQGVAIERFATPTLECLAALQHKPALAEILLKELRSTEFEPPRPPSSEAPPSGTVLATATDVQTASESEPEAQPPA